MRPGESYGIPSCGSTPRPRPPAKTVLYSSNTKIHHGFLASVLNILKFIAHWRHARSQYQVDHHSSSQTDSLSEICAHLRKLGGCQTIPSCARLQQLRQIIFTGVDSRATFPSSVYYCNVVCMFITLCTNPAV